jgi:hypothetical protein
MKSVIHSPRQMTKDLVEYRYLIAIAQSIWNRTYITT